MVGLTRSSKPEPNARARASVLLGLVATVVIPVGIYLSRVADFVSLLQAGVSVPVAAVCGLGAILLARRASQQVQRTIGRIGGERAARAGRRLGVLGLCLAFTAALALAFFGLLSLFAQ